MKPLQRIEFKEVRLNMNKMTDYLNNVRQKGLGGSHYSDVEETCSQRTFWYLQMCYQDMSFVAMWFMIGRLH